MFFFLMQEVLKHLKNMGKTSDWYNTATLKAFTAYNCAQSQRTA